VGGLAILSTEVDFKTCNLGASVTASVEVRNSGQTDEVVSFTFPSPSPWNSEFSRPSVTIPANTIRMLTVTFEPSGDLGPRVVEAALTKNGIPQSQKVTFKAVATSAQLAVERTDSKPFNYALNFGGVRLGRKSAFIVLKLKNMGGTLAVDAGTPSADAGPTNGRGRITLRDMMITSGDETKFTLEGLPPGTALEAGQSAEISVQFTPDKEGKFESNLVIASDASGLINMNIPLTGYGVLNQLLLSRPNINFGTRVAESTPSPVELLRITNEAIEPLRITAVQIVGAADHSEPSHFGWKLDETKVSELPYTLEPGDFVDLEAKYVPREKVISKATLQIVTDDVEARVATVGLEGQGLSSVFRALSSEVDFGTLRVGEVATKTLLLTNDSTERIVLRKPTFEGAGEKNFSVLAPPIEDTGRVIEAGARLTLELKFNTAQESDSRADLVLNTDNQDRPARVSLRGKAVASFLEISPKRVDFGWVDLGVQSEPQQITITNKSAYAKRVTIPDNPGSFFKVDKGDLEERDLAPGEEAVFHVSFQPAEGGSFSEELQLFLNSEAKADVSIPLTGRTFDGEGGCACGTGGGGASALLGLLGLVALRFRRRSAAR
ncbi:MAG TPA: choice-of-anchor D domain-containing protein, partial [Myxococcaceae bacterium]